MRRGDVTCVAGQVLAERHRDQRGMRRHRREDAQHRPVLGDDRRQTPVHLAERVWGGVLTHRVFHDAAGRGDGTAFRHDAGERPGGRRTVRAVRPPGQAPLGTVIQRRAPPVQRGPCRGLRERGRAVEQREVVALRVVVLQVLDLRSSVCHLHFHGFVCGRKKKSNAFPHGGHTSVQQAKANRARSIQHKRASQRNNRH